MSGLPAIPVMKMVAIWIRDTGKPIPKDMEGWMRAAKMYINIASIRN
jgi:hypothetical protein